MKMFDFTITNEKWLRISCRNDLPAGHLPIEFAKSGGNRLAFISGVRVKKIEIGYHGSGKHSFKVLSVKKFDTKNITPLELYLKITDYIESL